MTDIILVSLVNTRDQHAEREVANSVSQIAQAIRKTLRSNTLLVFSPKLECVDCAAILDQALGFKSYMIIENFHDSQEKYRDYPFIREKEITGRMLSPDFFANNYNEFFKALQTECLEGSVIILIDEEWFDRFHEFCNVTRSYGQAKLSNLLGNSLVPEQNSPQEFSGIDHQKEGEIFMKFQNNLIPEFREEIRQSRQGKLVRIEETIGKSASTMEIIEDSVRNLYSSAAGGSNDISNVDLDSISKEIEKQNKIVELIKQEIVHNEDLANTYSDTTVLDENPKISITKFFYEKDKNLWRIRVNNDTGVNFHNVDIYRAENKEIICSFAIVEANCQIWKTIKMGY